MRLGCLLTSCAILSSGACTVTGDGDPQGSGATGSVEETTIRVTRQQHRLPGPCRPRPMAQLVVRFIHALNTGDQTAVSNSFPRRGFQRYAVEGGPRATPDTSDLEALIAYFSERHEAGERLRLTALRVNYAEVQSDFGGTPIQPEPIAAIEFDLVRMADDLGDRKEVEYRGKAFIGCMSEKIFQWSMGPRDRRFDPVCPMTSGPSGRLVVVACA
jgi:hypothetical protein